MATLESEGLLKKLKAPVDVRNCSQIISENDEKATLFERVDGYEIPLIANAVSSRRMIALALDTSERGVLPEYLSRISNLVSPRFASESGLCQEKLIAKEESEVDLTSLPILLQHENDGAPYITAGVLVARDPETKVYNIGIYRLMFRSKNELGINITAPHKLRWFYQRAFDKREPLDVAVCIGLHALDLLAAVTSSAEVMDELAIWGGLQKSAIKMVHCKSIDLFVPEHCEMVLEGRMDPTGWTEPEGMYGEFPGTYSGMRKNPFLKIGAITSRKDPIYQSATHGGKNLGRTDFTVIVPQIELSVFQAISNAGIDVKQVRMVEESSGMICYVSIRPRAPGDAANALHVALAGSNQNFPKYCIVVDSDIDVFDNESLIWAVSTRTQPGEDAIIMKGLRIPSSSDPSLAGTRTMSKLGIDATIPFDADKERFARTKPPEASEFPKGRKEFDSEVRIKEIIVGLLREEGPLYFYDITKKLRDASFRNILLSWSDLRKTGQVEQGMDGKYSLAKKK